MSLVSVLGCGTWFFPIEEQLSLMISVTTGGSMPVRGEWQWRKNHPVRRNRVIMGQEYPFKLGQRRPNAREEEPMRTPQRWHWFSVMGMTKCRRLAGKPS